MSHTSQLLPHFGGHAIFDENVAADPEIRAYGEPRRLYGGLKVHPVIDHVGDELSVRQRLVGASHNAESNVIVAVLHKRRNDGMKRALVRGESVRLVGIEHEQGATVLQGKSHSAHRDPRTETGEVALNQRNDIALPVDNRQVGSVARWGTPGVNF